MMLAATILMSAALQITTPRAVPALAVTDTTAVEGYLTTLIEQEEGVPANAPNAAEDDDLRPFYTPGQSPCVASADGATLTCNVFYERGRWNGTLHAVMSVDDGVATTLTAADFDGNY